MGLRCGAPVCSGGVPSLSSPPHPKCLCQLCPHPALHTVLPNTFPSQQLELPRVSLLDCPQLAACCKLLLNRDFKSSGM